MTPAIVSRKVVGLPGVPKTCAFGSDTHSVSHQLNEPVRITKMRENCLKQFDEHWGCLEANNQVCVYIQLICANAHTVRIGLLPV